MASPNENFKLTVEDIKIIEINPCVIKCKNQE